MKKYKMGEQEVPYAPWTEEQIEKKFCEAQVLCSAKAKDLLGTLKEDSLIDDTQKLLMKTNLMNFFKQNKAPKKVLLDIPSSSN